MILRISFSFLEKGVLMLLPKTIDPIRVAKKGGHLHGELVLSQCVRLQAICDQANQTADVDLELNMDHQSRVPFIQGMVKAPLNLICQRCNAPMCYKLDISFLLSPVISEEEATRLPNMYEPIIVKDETVLLSEMIEDEILLTLPMVAKHEDVNCAVQTK